MSQTIYERSATLVNISLEPFIHALLPHLEVYGVRDSHSYRGYTIGRKIKTKHHVFGSEKEAHLTYEVDDNSSNEYAASRGYEKLQSFQLRHKTSGETLELMIDMELNLHLADHISFRFVGEASELEPLKEAVESLLKDCL